MSIVFKGHISNGRVVVNVPIDLPDGTGVLLTPDPAADYDGPLPPTEIARVLAAMMRLQPLDIPDTVAQDLDDWERTINRHGIDHDDLGMEDVIR